MSKKSRNFSFKNIMITSLFVLFAIGAVSAMYLSTRNQDLRQQAYGVCPGGKINSMMLDAQGNPGGFVCLPPCTNLSCGTFENPNFTGWSSLCSSGGYALACCASNQTKSKSPDGKITCILKK